MRDLTLLLVCVKVALAAERARARERESFISKQRHLGTFKYIRAVSNTLRQLEIHPGSF